MAGSCSQQSKLQLQQREAACEYIKRGESSRPGRRYLLKRVGCDTAVSDVEAPAPAGAGVRGNDGSKAARRFCMPYSGMQIRAIRPALLGPGQARVNAPLNVLRVSRLLAKQRDKVGVAAAMAAQKPVERVGGNRPCGCASVCLSCGGRAGYGLRCGGR